MNVIHLPENHPDRIAAVQRYEALRVSADQLGARMWCVVTCRCSLALVKF
jgi:hypothetical protein